MPVHIVGGDLTFAPGSDIAIAAGSIIKLPQGGYVHVQGALQSQGTQANPVIFTSNNDDSAGGDSNGDGNATTGVRGQWESLYIDSTPTTLNFTEVRYAGNANAPGDGYEPYRVPAIHVRGNISPSIQNSRIAFAENVGIQLYPNSSPLLENLRIESSGREAIFQNNSALPTYAGIVLSGNQGNRITWEGGTIDDTRTLDFQGIPVHLTTDLQFGPSSNITIVAGTILKFPTGAWLWSRGTLNANGTPEQPIVLTSTRDDAVGGDSNNDGAASQPGPGQWESVYLDTSTSNLTNVEIRYAGNVNAPGDTYEPYRTAAINVQAGNPSLKNTKVRFSENVGIRLASNTSARLEGVSIEDSGRQAIFQALTATTVYAGVAFRKNAFDQITLEGGTLNQSQSYDFQGLPVHLTTNLIVNAGNTLTLAPGTIFKFPQGGYLYAIGTLIADGSSQPIVFTSPDDDSIGGDSNGDGTASSPIPGRWQSVYIDSSSSVLKNVDVRYAGNVSNPGNAYEPYRVAAVNIRNSSAPLIQDTRILHSENVGLRIETATAARLQNVRIVDSGREAISQDLSTDTIYAGVVADKNVANRITLTGSFSGARTFDFNGITAHLAGILAIPGGNSLTLAPGTILKFGQGAYLENQGTLIATGTVLKPIILTSVQDDTAGGDTNADGTSTVGGPGQWQAFYVSSAATTLSYLEVRNAGNVSNPGNGYEPYRVPSIIIRAGQPISANNLRVVNAENDGILIQSGDLLALSDSQIVGVGRAAIRLDEEQRQSAPP